MHPPFTSEQFFDVFRRYNEAVWPSQIVLIAAGLVCAVAAYRANVRQSWRWARISIVLLAALWLWTGLAYHKAFFATLTPAGEIFGSIFIAEAALLLICAWPDSLLERASRPSLIAGTLIIGYALVIYPALGAALGHHYPAAPSFGTPCPTTIFTFGIFCLLSANIARFAVAIPVVWALIGSSAAFGFGVHEDIGLLVSAIAAIAVMHYEMHPPRVARSRRLTTTSPGHDEARAS